ncbi:group 1 truncated hemoglobin [Arenimonas sp.]|uniref:group I truncated hemoglobin n=1 Tax=Arenimonas sp. TaxID=1872635 RepID=UPI0039E60212
MNRKPFRSFALLFLLALFSPVCLAQDAETDEVPAEDVPADEAAPDEAQLPQRDPTAADPAPAHPELRAVFDQFGGEAGLTALMEEFMAQLLRDPRTKSFFENVDQKAVKRHLVEQFCAILGGGCEYTGRDMKSAHAGFGIDRAQFNALVEDLQIAMDKRGIPFRAQNKLLAKLAPMHREIEGR